MINRNQCIIIWYVDDNKLSHVDQNIVTEMLEEIKKHFGELVISRGDKHDFLGMKIKLRKDKLVEISIKKIRKELSNCLGVHVDMP